MKNKLFSLLIIVTAFIAITALDYQDVHAIQGGWAGNSSWAFAYAGCRIWCPWGQDWSFNAQLRHGGVATASDLCIAPGGPGWVWAWARAEHWWPFGSRVQSRIAARVPWPCWAYGKGEPKADSVVIEDTLDVQLDSIGGNQYLLRTTGEMKFYPQSAADETWAHAEIRVYAKGEIDSTDTTNTWPSADRTLFWGKIILAPYGPTIQGDYDTSQFIHSVVDDTLFVSFDIYDTIMYVGSATDSLYLGIRTLDRGTNVPTTTSWGIIILVALIVTSGVFIMLRRRKAVVPA